MTAAPEHKLLEGFQLAGLPTLPALILRYAPAEAESMDTEDRYGRTLASDAFLCLKLLGAYPDQAPSGIDGASALAGCLGADELASFVADAALQIAVAEDLAGLRFNFYKEQWRRSVINSAFMTALARRIDYANEERAALCGLLLDCGELVLENIHGDGYLNLHQQAFTEEALVSLEREVYELSHARAGATLLENLGMAPGFCDVLRYHHETREKMADAGRLAKMGWLAGNVTVPYPPGEAVITGAREWFGLDPDELQALIEQAWKHYNTVAAEYDILFDGSSRLPLREASLEQVTLADEEAWRRLREWVRDLGHFHTIRTRFAGVSGIESLGAVLDRCLAQIFGLRAFVLFAPDASGESLSPVAGNPAGEWLEELSIKNDGGKSNGEARSLVLQAYREGRALKLETGEEASPPSIMDRQLLGVFDTAGIYCDPVVRGGRCDAVLVVGFNGKQLNDYIDRSVASRQLKRELAAGLRARGRRTPVVEEILHEQKIREIIHEVNNPLSIARNYLQLLQTRQQDSRAVEDIKVLKTEIDRVSGIVGRLRKEGGPETVGPVDINQVVTSMARVLSSSVIENRKLVLNTQPDPSLPTIECSDKLIRQILTNLVINSVEAISAGGTVTVTTHALVIMDGKRFIELRVADDGPGIPPAVMERLFTYGNTTKGADHEGAGLAIVRELTERLGGRVSCRTGDGGTVMSVLLPIKGPGIKNDQ